MQLNQQQQAKLKQFMADKEMSKTVYDMLLASFLKPDKEMGVQELAAARLAVNYLNDAWRELDKQKAKVEVEKNIISQPGL